MAGKAVSAYSVETLAALPEFVGVGGDPSAAIAAAIAAHEAASDPHTPYLTQAEADARYALISGGQTVAGVREVAVTSDGQNITTAVQTAIDAVGADGIVVINGSGGLITTELSVTCAAIVPAYGRPFLRTNINNGQDVFQIPERLTATQNIARTIGPFIIDKASGFSGKPNCGAIRTGQGAMQYARRSAQYRSGTILTYVIAGVHHLFLVTNHNGITAASAPTLTAAAGNYTDGGVNLTYISGKESGTDTYPEVTRLVRSIIKLEVRNLVGSASLLGWQNQIDLSVQDCDYGAELAYQNGSEIFYDQRNCGHGLRLTDNVNTHIRQFNMQRSGTTPISADEVAYMDNNLEVRLSSGYVEVPSGGRSFLHVGNTVICRALELGPFTARTFAKTAGITADFEGGTDAQMPFSEAITLDRVKNVNLWGTGDNFNPNTYVRVHDRSRTLTTAGTVRLNGVVINPNQA